MSYTLIEILSYSIGIAALLGLARIQKIDRAFLPFILLLWIGLVNEILSTVVINVYGTNAINNNIYVLIESLLTLWLFKNWKIFDRQPKLFTWVGILFIVVWLVDNFIVSSITQFTSYFRVVYSFVVVIMSIHMINRLITQEKGWLLTNAIFLITLGFIVFFTYKTLIEIFYIYGLSASDAFGEKVYRIVTYINLAVNIIYAIAVLWIPRKQESLLQ